MSTTRRNQRRNAFVASILAMAGFAVPAVAAEQPSNYQDNITPMSASQNAMLRHGKVADEAAASPSHQSVPASRSQIEVLDLNGVHHAQVTLASH